MSEHDKQAEAREALEVAFANATERRRVGFIGRTQLSYETARTILAALDGHAAALEAARREGASEAFERAAALAETCRLDIAESLSYEQRAERGELAAAIRALAEREVRT